MYTISEAESNKIPKMLVFYLRLIIAELLGMQQKSDMPHF